MYYLILFQMMNTFEILENDLVSYIKNKYFLIINNIIYI